MKKFCKLIWKCVFEHCESKPIRSLATFIGLISALAIFFNTCVLKYKLPDRCLNFIYQPVPITNVVVTYVTNEALKLQIVTNEITEFRDVPKFITNIVEETKFGTNDAPIMAPSGVEILYVNPLYIFAISNACDFPVYYEFREFGNYGELRKISSHDSGCFMARDPSPHIVYNSNMSEGSLNTEKDLAVRSAYESPSADDFMRAPSYLFYQDDGGGKIEFCDCLTQRSGGAYQQLDASGGFPTNNIGAPATGSSH